MSIIEAITAEKLNRQRDYQAMIDQAIDRLQRAKGSPASTHLGHNIGSLAHEITVAAAKVEEAEAVLRFIEP